MAPIEDEPYRIHVTGFGPFRNFEDVNPSWLAVKELEGLELSEPPSFSHSSHTVQNGTTTNGTTRSSKKRRRIVVSTELVQVAYSEIDKRVPQMHGLSPGARAASDDKALRADMILHCGVGHPAIKLEGLARRGPYASADARNETLPVQQGREKPRFEPNDGYPAEDEYVPIVDREAVCDWVATKGANVQLSSDAGLYLCEYILYSSLRAADIAAKQNGRPVRPVLFCHVCPIEKPYSTRETTDILKLIIWAIVNEGGLL